MDDRKLALIESLIHYLEQMDGDALHGDMKPKEGGVMVAAKMDGGDEMPKEQGPMDELMAHSTDPKSDMGDEEMSDEELEELQNLNA